jgi:uncharacterized membrane protein (UPF0127 family)
MSTTRSPLFLSFAISRLFARAIGLLAILAAAWLSALPSTRAAEQQTLEIASKDGVHVFSVELAVTDAERSQGLMFRRSVPDGYGMLFDFKTDQDVTMWMKNTFVSLDMIFIRSDGRILRIAESTEPQSERIIPSGGPVRAVLEVVAGTAKKYGIVPGDRVASPILRR